MKYDRLPPRPAWQPPGAARGTADSRSSYAWKNRFRGAATPYRAPVLDVQGKVIGQTESLLGDDEADIFHGLAVKLSDGGRLVEIPAARIPRITRTGVHTDVRPGEAASLQPYREEHWYHLGWGGLFRRRPEWRDDV